MAETRRFDPRTTTRIRFILVGVVAFATSCGAPRPDVGELPTLIAHAGGIGNHRTYTNSLEALDRSAAHGYTAIEIDFSWTRDNHLVLLHDWTRDVPRLFDRPPGKMSLEEFRSARPAAGLTLLTLGDLETWLEENPGILVVTDFKERPLEGLRRIADAFPRHLHRIAPQIYQPDELEAVRDLGFGAIVWTLYNSDVDDDGVVDFASRNRLFGVTMPLSRALTTDLPMRLSAAGVPVFVHTVNDYPTFLDLQDRGVVGVYTDWLSPGDADAPSRLDEWVFEKNGCEPVGFSAIPFVPSSMPGLQIALEFRNNGADRETLHIELEDQTGAALGAAEFVLDPGEEEFLEVADLFPTSVDHGWIRIVAASVVEASSRWVFRDNPVKIRATEPTACIEFVARGPGDGVSGLLAAVVNPTGSTHIYTLRRIIGQDLVDEDAVELDPGHQLIRVYRSGTAEPIKLTITGGPMVATALRWDPLVRSIE